MSNYKNLKKVLGMNSTDFATLRARAAARKLSSEHLYAGEVTPQEALHAVLQLENAVLVDVRTDKEWQGDGVPDLSDKNSARVLLSWRLYPDMTFNTAFVSTLRQRCDDVATPLFFLCRSGVRSLDAANIMAQEGYQHCFNVAAGCLGSANMAGEENTVLGWKLAGLPWGAL